MTSAPTSPAEVTPARTPAKRLPSLTSLRAFGALFVYFNHSGYILLDQNPGWYNHYSFYVYNVGGMSLSFFFVLSGFVLTWGSRATDTARGFWRGRFFKIFPNHLLVFFIAFGMLLASGEGIKVAEAVANLFLVQSWFTKQSYFVYPVNGVTWSLSVEMLCYLFFPLLLRVVRRVRVERLWLWIGVFAVTVMAVIPLFAATFLPKSPESPFEAGVASWAQHWFVFFFPVTRSAEFIIGMLLARVISEGRWPKVLGLREALGVTVVFYVIGLYVPKLLSLVAVFTIPVIVIIGATATSDLADRMTFLRTRAMLWFGDISFAFYVTHVTALFAVHAAFAHQWFGYGYYTPPKWSTFDAILYMVAALPMCILIAGALYTFVERPMMNRFARPKPRRRPGVTDPAAPLGVEV
ncbi:acyltransferase family protein [Catenulispora rubra]|uniref:acyltransferase family protein n=1 Tax=Catenulispora rubra TaxID=280293 RepID=UPI0018923535|nr:acyltransferase [Catenulispora rubra]